MLELKRQINRFLREYDKLLEEIELLNNIILSYEKQYQEIGNNPQNDKYKEVYLKEEFETFKRGYGRQHEWLLQKQEIIVKSITKINKMIGYEENNADSDSE
jgi:hypothetical protein